MNPAQTYLSELARYFADTTSSEMSYRTPFQAYLETIFPKSENYHIQHDAKSVEGNKPDFIVLRDGVPLLYIEVKKVGEDLDKIEKSSQAARYFGYTNLIISDYAEFRFFRNGQRYEAEPIKLADVHKSSLSLTPHSENGERLVRTIQDFVTSQKEPIKSGKHLAKIMGGKAQRIRDNVIALLLSTSPDREDLLRMMRVIKDHLVTNLTDRDFADMYAQTLVYGLFAARYSDDTAADFSRQEARDLVPATNPFLRHFFDHISGATFPKRLNLIVEELCVVFSHADVKTLMEEYFKQTDLMGEIHEAPDPVIHFYEDFLREYDPGKKMEMGVFYTPLPVVRFIVRGIDSILKTEFGIAKGVADNSKMPLTLTTKNDKGKNITETKEVHKVQLLDLATGTGTFLNETVLHIHETLKSQQGRWCAYVESDLLPRLHGFELMMASYTVAHLKLALTLQNTGIAEFKQRLGIYLTNTLDEAHDVALQSSLFGFLDSITEESKLASEVKRDYPIMVVMGNPPYSGESMNPHYTGNNVYKFELGGKEKLKEKNSKWINDDYVKFIRFAESMVEKNGEGVIGMITSHGYIDNPTFRGMRWHLRQTFDKIYIVDLHGNSNKKETAPDGTPDKNVFDIKTGVSIIFGVKKYSDSKNKKSLATVYQVDLYGKREQKFDSLAKESIESIAWKQLPADCDVWKIEGEGKSEYQKGFSVAELFPVNANSIVTKRDSLTIDDDQKRLWERVNFFIDNDESSVRAKLKLPADVRDWQFEWAKNDLLLSGPSQNHIKKISYRPFDVRHIYYTGNSRGFVGWPVEKIMKHYLNDNNVGLLLTKGVRDPIYNHVFITKNISEAIFLSGTTATNAMNLPLYLYSDDGTKVANLNAKIVADIQAVAGETTPEDILDYIYAVLHSPTYRTTYAEFLKSDFPRVPYLSDKETFWKLVPLGTKLRNLHLLTDPSVHAPVTTFPITGSNEVLKPIWKNGKVYLNDEQYWDGVPEAVWNFYIGGYQPAQKYLKDRKGRQLTNDEFENYEKMIVSLKETIRVMGEIDGVLKI